MSASACFDFAQQPTLSNRDEGTESGQAAVGERSRTDICFRK